MKRDKALMRKLLARLEGLPLKMGDVWTIGPDDPQLAIDGYSPDHIDYHLTLLKDGRYIDCPGSQPMMGITFRGLTERGHDFLDENPNGASDQSLDYDAGQASNKAKLDDLFARYDELSSDVGQSSHMFFVDNLRRWFALLDGTTPFARPILQQLETAADFNTWFEPHRMAMSGAGSGKPVEWPADHRKRLGLHLLLFRQFATGGIEPGIFALTVMHTGQHIQDGISAIANQMFSPFSRDLRRYLAAVTDYASPMDTSSQGPRQSASRINSAATMITIHPTIYSLGPNAQIQVGQDNSISVDTQSVDFREFQARVEKVVEAVRNSNELPTEAKEQIGGELRAGMEIIKTPKPDRGALHAYLMRPLQWLAKELASGTIRAAAAAALKTLMTIAAELFK